MAMTDAERIAELEAALVKIATNLNDGLSDAEHGTGPDHDGGQIMCDAMSECIDLAWDAWKGVRAALNAGAGKEG